MKAILKVFLSSILILAFSSFAMAQSAEEELSISQFLMKLKKDKQLDKITAKLEGILKKYGVNQLSKTPRYKQFVELLKKADNESFKKIEDLRFPTLSQDALRKLQPILAEVNFKAPKVDKEVNGDLMTLLNDSSTLKQISSISAKGISQGHPLDDMMSEKTFIQSKNLARILTALSLNGTKKSPKSKELFDSRISVKDGAKDLIFKNPRDLISYLLKNNHSITVRNERTFADFLALNYNGQTVAWPVWVDTGIPITAKPGDKLVIPSGHSHHAWSIRGPKATDAKDGLVVNAEIMFYLGTDGAQFYAKTSQRPLWTGWRILDKRTAENDNTHTYDVVNTFKAASGYLKRNRIERHTIGNAAGDGYGLVGVCNDSNALVELLTNNTITTYPLYRSDKYDSFPKIDDGLQFVYDESLVRLPSDLKFDKSKRKSTLKRVLMMMPDTDGNLVKTNNKLGYDIGRINKEVNQ